MTPDPSASSRGLLTLAVGNPRYLEMAVDLALSARKRVPRPMALAADPELGRKAAALYPTVFSHIVEIAPRFRPGRAVKYGVADASPFEQTMYLDADCLVLAGLDEYWEPLRGQSLALVGEHLGPEANTIHHGFPVANLVAEFGLETYLKSNSGVFYFERSAALPIMEACLKCYREEILTRLRGGFLGDELALGVVGGRLGLSTFPHPSPMHWNQELATLDADHPTRPVCHFIGRIPTNTLAALMAAAQARRRQAGLPSPEPTHWAWKHRRVVRSRIRARLLQPLLPIARLLGLASTRHV